MNLLELNEYGFLSVPPPCRDVSLNVMPGVFGNTEARHQMWQTFLSFVGLLRSATTIRRVYVDGEYISALDNPEFMELGVELHDGITRAEISALNQPFDQEWGIMVNFYSPRRPEVHNFHHAFQRPDPTLNLGDLPDALRKGYLCVSI
jgi:hypothetical protein